MTRVLILGATGMLGHKLFQVLGADSTFEVHGTCRTPHPALSGMEGTMHAGIDLGRGAEALAPILSGLSPDVVINAVGAIKQRDLYSAMDATFFLNGTLPHLIPLLNSNKGARLIHFSTDCVFKGDRGGYSESERPDAEDLYGRSKACGEVDYGRHLTIRTSIVGFELTSHLSLLSWLIRQPAGATLRGFSRAMYSGLPTMTLARTVWELLRADRPLGGLYHVASEPISKYDMLSRLARALSLPVTFEVDDTFVIDRTLDDSRFRRDTGSTRPGWDLLIEELVRDFRSLPYASLAVRQPTGAHRLDTTP